MMSLITLGKKWLFLSIKQERQNPRKVSKKLVVLSTGHPRILLANDVTDNIGKKWLFLSVKQERQKS